MSVGAARSGDTARGGSISRREVLRALGALALAPSILAADPGGRRALEAIDVHHHVMPPAYLAAARGRIAAAMPGFTSLLDWQPEHSLEQMDLAGVATAILSISAPGIWLGDPAESRHLARLCNDYTAGLTARHRGRFGFFATLPLPDVEGSLREIERALDELGAQGIVLMTSYGEHWPGDPAFAPVLDELARRRAVIYFHPVAPACCVNVLPQVPPAIVEFPFATTRAIMSLLYSGTLTRCRTARFLFSHGGGAVPMLSSRIATWAGVSPQIRARVPEGALAELQRLFFDTASVTNRPAFAALHGLVPTSQILLGSDYPFGPLDEAISSLAGLGLSAAELRAIGRDNAAALLAASRREG